MHGFSHRLVAQQVFDGRPHDKEHAIATYMRNIEEVKSYVAPDRLLIHHLGDGWDPLCEWLNLPVPDLAYPEGNTTEDFNRRIKG